MHCMESPCICMEAPCTAWKPPALHGSPMQLHGIPLPAWNPPALHGSPLHCMEAPCTAWKPHALHGSPMHCMEAPCTAWKPHCLLDSGWHSRMVKMTLASSSLLAIESKSASSIGSFTDECICGSQIWKLEWQKMPSSTWGSGLASLMAILKTFSEKWAMLCL